MSVKIRLARHGRKKRPFYSLVVANSQAPRDGQFIEKIGTYDPMLPKESQQRVVIKHERAQHWLSVGAQPTDKVVKFFSQQQITLPAKLKAKEELKFKSRVPKAPKKEA